MIIVFGVLLILGGLVLNGIWYANKHPGDSPAFDKLLTYLGLKDD